jgi:surfeit locus 1 family protein
MLAHVVVAVLVVLFVTLGFWQLRRLEEKKLSNAVGEARFNDDPVDVAELLTAVGGDVDSLEFRHASATGVFHPEDEVLIRSQVEQGVAGFHVVTPLVGEEGRAILVNRGWVPLGMDRVPVSEALPPDGVVTVEGWVRLTQEPGAIGPKDPEGGRLVAMNRVNIDRIQDQVPYEVEPVYLSMLGEQSEGQPILVAAPTFDDEGPHLSYAIQWFAFAAIGIIGYFMLIRRAVRRSG